MEVRIKSNYSRYARLFILFFIFVLTFYPTGLKKDPDIKEILTNLNQNIQKQILDKDNVRLAQILSVREDYLKAEIKNNPQNAAQYFLSENERDVVPVELKTLVETQKKIVGDFERVEIDYKDGSNTFEYRLNYIEGGNKESANVFLTDKNQDLVSAKGVIAEGVFLGGYYLSSTAQVGSSNVAPAVTPLDVTGNDNILVIRANFQNNSSYQLPTATDVQTELLSATDSTGNYFNEASYGVYSINSVMVTDWYTVPYDSTGDCTANYYNWSSSADAMARAAGQNPDNYDKVMYLFAPSSGCPWAGLGYLPGDTTWFFAYNMSPVYSHELGHNIGLHHAASYDCGASTIDIYSNCTMTEYGDYYDVMGSTYTMAKSQHFSAAFKESLGWIDNAQVINATTSGRYTINYLEDSNVGPQAIKVRKGNTNEYYYLDYRKPTGFDSSFTAYGYTQSGAMGHIWSEASYSKSYLIDFQPNNALTPYNDLQNATLLDGVPFVDAANGITLTQVSHDANTVTLDVIVTTYSVTATAGANGTISLSGATNYSAGDSPTYTVTPNTGYMISDVLVDGISVGAVTSYTFTNISANHTISATFRSPQFSFFSPGMGNENMPATQNGIKTIFVAPYNEIDHYLTGYSGVVTFASSDDTAVLPTDNGTGWTTSGDLTYKYFQVTFKKLGAQTLTLTDSNTGRSTIYNFTVSTGPLSHIHISPNTTQTTVSGQTVQFTAQGQDGYNNDISGLTYTWTGTNSSGLFTNSTPGSYQVRATSGGVNSSYVTVNVNATPALNHFVVTGNGGNKIAGTQFNITVTAYDQYDQVYTDFMGPVTITSNDAQGIMPEDWGVGWSGGQASFSVTLKRAGTTSITINNLGGTLNATVTANVVPGSLHHINITPSSSQNIVSGQTVQFAAQGQDEYDNSISGLTYTWSGTNSSGLFTGSVEGTFTVKASGGGIESQNVAVNVTALTPTIQCRAHVQDIGWMDWVNDSTTCGTSGRGLRAEAIQLRLVNAPVGMSIQYRGHVENIGWQDWVSDGVTAGTSGQALRVEALQVTLTGAPPGVSVQCRAHVQYIGWKDWVNDTEICGTTGQGLRVEALQLRLVNAPVGMSIQYRGHVQYIGWQPWVSDGATAGTSGQSLRLEAIQARLVDAPPGVSIQCRAHIQYIGWMSWVNDTETCGTSGQSLRVEAIQLRLVNAPVDMSIQYRGHVQYIGWQPWVSDGATAGTTGQSLRVEALQVRLLQY